MLRHGIGTLAYVHPWVPASPWRRLSLRLGNISYEDTLLWDAAAPTTHTTPSSSSNSSSSRSGALSAGGHPTPEAWAAMTVQELGLGRHWVPALAWEVRQQLRAATQAAAETAATPSPTQAAGANKGGQEGGSAAPSGEAAVAASSGVYRCGGGCSAAADVGLWGARVGRVRLWCRVKWLLRGVVPVWVPSMAAAARHVSPSATRGWTPVTCRSTHLAKQLLQWSS
jgi:hypothetical protein